MAKTCPTKGKSLKIKYRGKRFCCRGKTSEVGKGKKKHSVSRVVCFVVGKARKNPANVARGHALAARAAARRAEKKIWAIKPTPGGWQGLGRKHRRRSRR
jgi:hypothetical protein